MATSHNWLTTKIGHWLTKNRPPRRVNLCDFDRIRYEIRPGDVLLIEGRNHISTIIRRITQSPWSHAALYVGRLYDVDDPELRKKIRQRFGGSSDSQLLIESMIGKGTIITPLSHYRHDHIRICRPQGLSRSDAQKVIGYAITRLGGKYNVRHVVDLARLLLPWGVFPRRWRSSLFEYKPSQPIYDICSSMIAEAFASVKFPILPIVKHDDDGNGIELIQRNPRLFTPSDFDYSPYFDIIKYPFFSILETPSYHHLPWKEGAISVDDESEAIVNIDKSSKLLDKENSQATLEAGKEKSAKKKPKKLSTREHLSGVLKKIKPKKKQ
jgi:hypothetical protein